MNLFKLQGTGLRCRNIEGDYGIFTSPGTRIYPLFLEERKKNNFRLYIHVISSAPKNNWLPVINDLQKLEAAE